MKIVIDSFEDKDQAEAFIKWFKKQADLNKINIKTKEDKEFSVSFDEVNRGAYSSSKLAFTIKVKPKE